MNRREKLTKAQRRCLGKLGAPNTYGCAWGHTYKPPLCLVRDGLARQDGYLQGRPFYRITDAGRSLLQNPWPKPDGVSDGE